MGPADIVAQLLAIDAKTVLIDGRSGSGKTTLAGEVARQWDGSILIHLDDIYPGWDGLQAAAAHIHRALLAPRQAGCAGRWRRWDWTTGTAAEWHTVEARQRLVIEGAGALTGPNRALADMGIWVDCPTPIRKRRALARDGAGYAEHWDRWAAQECEHIDHHHPRSLADFVVDETMPIRQ
ncbi:MAG: hypothetical protein ABWY93_32260 [Mycobacterium sp.]